CGGKTWPIIIASNLAKPKPKIYKAKTKTFHDKHIHRKFFQVHDKVWLFNSRLRGKLKSRWDAPYTIVKAYDNACTYANKNFTMWTKAEAVGTMGGQHPCVQIWRAEEAMDPRQLACGSDLVRWLGGQIWSLVRCSGYAAVRMAPRCRAGHADFLCAAAMVLRWRHSCEADGSMAASAGVAQLWSGYGARVCGMAQALRNQGWARATAEPVVRSSCGCCVGDPEGGNRSTPGGSGAYKKTPRAGRETELGQLEISLTSGRRPYWRQYHDVDVVSASTPWTPTLIPTSNDVDANFSDLHALQSPEFREHATPTIGELSPTV
ncbi:hypothetical protein Taro_008941, partial [Colocasia esculenta]|nr:hypothetical protein [Colocasia esculenta]